MSEIRVFARFRPLPSRRASRYESLSVNSDTVNITVGDKDADKFSGNHYNEHSFRFKKVFDENAAQQDVFDVVAVEMIDKFLEGFNGTLFAYGQTASGKSYTIEGGASQFKERGIIPRTISYIYSALESRKQATEDDDNGGDLLSTVHISYMEIYQDIGYDLLNPGCRNEGLLLNLPRVFVSEGQNEEVYVRNLSSHLASNEEVALSLLFQGSTCRRVAETSMNLSSSRSHAIFTFTLTSQRRGSEMRTRSKLNLVDLAGSERVYKTCATGQVLQEAKHINLSLHHLEHVIVVLQKRTNNCRSQPVTPSSSADTVNSQSQNRRLFVPYRNSLLTMVLRDSLGGNCITAMIANLSLDRMNLLETISTCRFAQRVACISNKARRNEELDDKVVIRKLKEQVSKLQQEIRVLKENCPSHDRNAYPTSPPSELNDEQKKKCHKVLYDFLHGRLTDPVSEGINTPSLFKESLTILKEVIVRTVKENKKYKQKSVEETSIPKSSNPTPESIKSISRQSQASSGFVSLKDDGLQESYAQERITPAAKQTMQVRTRHPTHHVEKLLAVTSKADKRKEQKQLAIPPSSMGGPESDLLVTKVNAKHQRSSSNERKKSLSLEVNSMRASLQKHNMEDLMKRVNNVNMETIQESTDRSTSSKPSFQHVKGHSPTDEKVVEERLRLKMLEREDDLRLAKLQKQLELKEAATRKRLRALKMELQSSTNSSDNEVGVTQLQHINFVEQNNHLKSDDHIDKVKAMNTSRTDDSGYAKEGVRKMTRTSAEDYTMIAARSPVQSSEKLYSKALDKHKVRVTQIRQCIKAAIIIQRAWRRYKK